VRSAARQQRAEERTPSARATLHIAYFLDERQKITQTEDAAVVG